MTALRLVADNDLPRPGGDDVEPAYDEAMRLLRAAQAEPSIANMAAAVDAWRRFERLLGTRVI